jgi:DNA-binding NtrC family response regulator
MPHALIVDDDLSLMLGLAEMVQREGFTTSTAGSVAQAREALAERTPDVMLIDLNLPDGLGIDLLTDLEQMPRTQAIIMTSHGSIEQAVEAMRKGAVHFLTKPLDFAAIKATLATVQHARRLTDEVASLRGELRELGHFGALVGAAPNMQRVFDLIERVARTDATVLIVGETGTGKELVAQSIHSLSRRRLGEFVAVNCGAVSPTLIESELFGHERGSFTGAQRQHRGHFERANKGTLFLDEITEMPADLQVKLLRVLETRTIQRVGGQETLPIDVRILASTNRSLPEAIAAGKLREDLHYRLAVFPIHVPPLRERIEDVEMLARHFLSELNRLEGTTKEFSRAALVGLKSHQWPGNVRELRNVVQRAFIMSEDVIGSESIPVGECPAVVAGSGSSAFTASMKAGMSLAEAERQLILATLAHCDADKKQAATILGISLKTLYTRLREYKVS